MCAKNIGATHRRSNKIAPKQKTPARFVGFFLGRTLFGVRTLLFYVDIAIKIRC